MEKNLGYSFVLAVIRKKNELQTYYTVDSIFRSLYIRNKKSGFAFVEKAAIVRVAKCILNDLSCVGVLGVSL